MFATRNFRTNLRYLLEERGISQREVATRAEVSYPYVNRILQGKVTPAIDICDSLADAVGMELPQMLLHPRVFARNSRLTPAG